MTWREFQVSTPIEKNGLNGKSPVEETGAPPLSVISVKSAKDCSVLMTTTDDPEGSRAMLFNVPSIGDFWCVVDDTARAEVASDGLPCLLPDDLAFITEGSSKQDRFNRLLGRVSLNHPTVQGIIEIFPGSKATKVSRRTAS